MISQEKQYLIALNCNTYLRGNRILSLLEYFKSAENLYKASANDLINTGIKEEIAEKIKLEQKKIVLGEEEKKGEKLNIKITTIFDEDYPLALKQIAVPPPVLYYKGQLSANNDNLIAIVGCRKSTTYGNLITENIVRDLVDENWIIVSGMARGIDTAAHKSCLSAGGKTIAVLGCGLDIVYPPENKNLAEKIIENGCLISEFPLGTRPFAANFPQRNRIISGLSKGVVVVQAALRSGALITASFALEQNKEVFAVAGNINLEQSKGPHFLIKQGAKLVENAQDILEEFGIFKKTNNQNLTNKIVEELTAEEKIIYNNLSFEPKVIDEIIQQINLNASKVNSTLLLLEIKNLIKKVAGNLYVRVR